MKRTCLASGFATLAIGLFASMALAASPWLGPATPAPAPEVQPPDLETNLKVFGTLDFDVF